MPTFTRAAFIAVLSFTALPALADDDALATARAEITEIFGSYPAFLNGFPDAALPGAWEEVKAIELTDGALNVKTKALIALAVAAQIPCNYCVWSDIHTARSAGATDAEINEAIAVSAVERHWSTWLNGSMTDFDQFKADMGGN